MKFLIPFIAIFVSCSSPAEDKAPSYKSEASLPKGWPQPGPYNQVSEKEYPAYRAAFTGGEGSNPSFWTLFKHIKSKNIPMTAPVEMKMNEKDGKMKMVSMAFLYQDTTVGEKGKDGEKVDVRDLPKSKVLSYTWMGPRNDKTVATAKAALQKSLVEKNLKTTGFRILGYNGPMTSRKKQTHELQALLK